MKKYWDRFSSWEAAEKGWDEGANSLQKEAPLQKPKHLPKVPSITQETKRFLKFKTLHYMIRHDSQGVLRRYILKRPLIYPFSYLKSALKKNSYQQRGDFFLYGLKSINAFKEAVARPDTLLILGFSFCQKPLSCPSERFTDQCLADPENPHCRQCLIGKAVNSLPDQKIIPLFIPTIHYIGEKIFELLEKHPHKKLLFLITACELSLKMFSDFGNMIGLQGIGVRLDGRICNTFAAFKFAEKGIKPGLTLLSKETEIEFFKLLRILK